MQAMYVYCLQAQLWCTASRAKKVVVSLTLFAVAASVLNKTVFTFLAQTMRINLIHIVIFNVMVPVAVLVINVVVVIQVRLSLIHI